MSEIQYSPFKLLNQMVSIRKHAFILSKWYSCRLHIFTFQQFQLSFFLVTLYGCWSKKIWNLWMTGCLVRSWELRESTSFLLSRSARLCPNQWDQISSQHIIHQFRFWEMPFTVSIPLSPFYLLYCNYEYQIRSRSFQLLL